MITILQYCALILYVPTIHAILIQTPLGKINGLKEDIKDVGSIYKFVKIPYAKPPLGDRRFAKPEVFGSWPNVLDATTYGPSCIQKMDNSTSLFLKNLEVSEDCLFLNIYVPYDIDYIEKRSVMVWIHGGSFQRGQGMLYNPTRLALVGNVIVVTINYRLGAFGFFYAGNSDSTGNYGLWDQKLALEWVKENIETFGGDSNSITLFGESAGGVSVNLLALKPEAKGLFQRIICQSGVAFIPGAVRPPSQMIDLAQQIANSTGCGSDWSDPAKLMQCIRRVPAQLILKIDKGHRPIVDGEFITDYPENLLMDKTSEAYSFFRSLDLMTGTTIDDGSLLLSIVNISMLQEEYNFKIEEGIPSSVYCEAFVPTVAAILQLKDKQIVDAMCKMYKNQSSDTSQGRKVIEFLGDGFFLIPAVKLLNIHSSMASDGKTFQYLFIRTNVLIKTLFKRYNWIQGAIHADELPFMFGLEEIADYFGMSLLDDDVTFIRQMAEYWTNFAKTGNPNSGNLTRWPEYDQSDSEYLVFGQDGIQVGADIFSPREKFWMEEIPKMLASTQNDKPVNSALQLNFSCVIYISIILNIIHSLYVSN